MAKKIDIEMTNIICRRNDIPSIDLDGEIGMMNIESGKYYALDSVSARIWELIEKPISVKEVITKLLDEYEVDKESCTKEVIEFVNNLVIEKLIEVE